MRSPEAGPDGKIRAGMRLHDWTLPNGWVREVVQVWGPEHVIVEGEGLYRGSSAERCALHGGTAQWREAK